MRISSEERTKNKIQLPPRWYHAQIFSRVLDDLNNLNQHEYCDIKNSFSTLRLREKGFVSAGHPTWGKVPQSSVLNYINKPSELRMVHVLAVDIGPVWSCLLERSDRLGTSRELESSTPHWHLAVTPV